MTTTHPSPNHLLSADVESKLGDLTTAHTWWKEHILSLLSVLITLEDDDHDALAQRLAGILMRPISRIEQAAAGLELLTHMPKLHSEITSDSTLDLDMLATIATQASKFDEIDYDELEKVLTTIFYGDTPCTSPAKLQTQIRKASYTRCKRKMTRPSKKSKASPQNKKPAPQKFYTWAPPHGLTSECYQPADPEIDSMVFDPVTSTCHIRLACTPSHFNLMKRLVIDHAEKRSVTFADALMRLISGEKRARINLYAFGVPGGRLLVEGRGWIKTEDLGEKDVLLLKDFQLAPSQLAELLLGKTSLDYYTT